LLFLLLFHNILFYFCEELKNFGIPADSTLMTVDGYDSDVQVTDIYLTDDPLTILCT